MEAFGKVYDEKQIPFIEPTPNPLSKRNEIKKFHEIDFW